MSDGYPQQHLFFLNVLISKIISFSSWSWSLEFSSSRPLLHLPPAPYLPITLHSTQLHLLPKDFLSTHKRSIFLDSNWTLLVHPEEASLELLSCFLSATIPLLSYFRPILLCSQNTCTQSEYFVFQVETIFIYDQPPESHLSFKILRIKTWAKQW